MIIELHIIQNFAPSNLNRDDTGAPKDCEFGGYRRARLSSQAIKRAVRREFTAQALLPADRLATRTKRLVDEAADRLVKTGKDSVLAKGVVQVALTSMGLGLVETTVRDESVLKTQYLLYLGASEIEQFARICLDNWDELVAAATASQGTGRGVAKKSGSPQLGKQLQALLDGGKAADLALFGRMLADLPERNIDAASQVAHALSTHQVSVEFDYYTAVDDLKPEDTAGADMIGTVEFNSACYYRYANVHTGQLVKNLSNDEELARQTVGAYLRALVDAIPTGKQNSMAAQNPPSFVMTVVRPRGLWSLANAFVRPVRPQPNADLVAGSVAALDRYWQELTDMYGRSEGSVRVATMEGEALDALKGSRLESVPALIQATVAAAFGGGAS